MRSKVNCEQGEIKLRRQAHEASQRVSESGGGFTFIPFNRALRYAFIKILLLAVVLSCSGCGPGFGVRHYDRVTSASDQPGPTNGGDPDGTKQNPTTPPAPTPATGEGVTVATDVPEPFQFGFLGFDGHLNWQGFPGPNVNARFSTWHDVAAKQGQIDLFEQELGSIATTKKIMVNVQDFFVNMIPGCTPKSENDCVRWGGFEDTFLPKFTETINGDKGGESFKAIIEANKGRIWSFWVFDEPDVPHGGPDKGELEKAIKYLNATFANIPAFVGWFEPENNEKTPGNNWTMTTNKGDSVNSLARYGKPMFLWWFNNEASPRVVDIVPRWNEMVAHYYQNKRPKIMGVGWCCDDITNFERGRDGLVGTDNTHQLNAILRTLGEARRTTGRVFRVPTARFSEENWFVFNRDANGSISYTNESIFDAYYKRVISHPQHRNQTEVPEFLPLKNVKNSVGGQYPRSPFYPAAGLSIRDNRSESKMIDLVWTGADGAVYHGQLAPNGEFGPARSLGISSVAQPDVVTYKDNVWMAVRGTDNAIYVKRLYANPDSARFNDEPFVKLPCDARGYPFFKKGDNDLHIATFMATGKAHIRRLMSADKGTWTENWEDADIATID